MAKNPQRGVVREDHRAAVDNDEGRRRHPRACVAELTHELTVCPHCLPPVDVYLHHGFVAPLERVSEARADRFFQSCYSTSSRSALPPRTASMTPARSGSPRSHAISAPASVHGPSLPNSTFSAPWACTISTKSASGRCPSV